MHDIIDADSLMSFTGLMLKPRVLSEARCEQADRRLSLGLKSIAWSGSNLWHGSAAPWATRPALLKATKTNDGRRLTSNKSKVTTTADRLLGGIQFASAQNAIIKGRIHEGILQRSPRQQRRIDGHGRFFPFYLKRTFVCTPTPKDNAQLPSTSSRRHHSNELQ